MQILLWLCLAGAVIGLLLYAHGFSSGLWPWKPAPQDTARPDELPRLPDSPYEPDRRRDTRDERIAEWIEYEIDSGQLDARGAIIIMDLLMVSPETSMRVIAGRKVET